MMASSEDPNWVFDYALIEDDLTLPLTEVSGFNWSASPAHGFASPAGDLRPGHSHQSVDVDHSLLVPDEFMENGSRKRARSACAPSGSKACKEKIRRDKLNDRFMELGCILEPGRPSKVDKAVILNDAIRLVTQLQDETKKLKETSENLQHKLTELKAEKNELRDEKHSLKMEKEILEMQVKVLPMQLSFLPHPAACPAPFATQSQLNGGKFGPYIRYPGMPMWQFMPPAAVDTSQDHVLRPPVA